MTTISMISPRPAGFPLWAFGGLCALMLLGAPASGFAQGRLDARYEARKSVV